MTHSNTLTLELKSIRKAFGGVPALCGASFALRAGEIHALLGENGAGKSTLMNVATGIYQPDSGDIAVAGRPVRLTTPRAAKKLGIGMVHQHFHLSRRHTVLDNILLGLPGVSFLPDRRALAGRIRNLADRYGLPVDPEAKVWQLSVGEQQRVEIVKTLIHEARVLILDEPTAVLSPLEAKELFAVLARLKADGCSIIFISHKLDEIKEISDRVTIMRCGETVATVETGSSSTRDLALHMVGREVFLMPTHRERTGDTQRPLLSLSKVTVSNDRGVPALRGVSFDLLSSEILGVAGLSGNGQTELTEILYGLRRPESGTLTLEGAAAPVTMSPREAISRKISFIPADRRMTGTAPGLSIRENLMLKSYREAPYSSRGFLRPDVMAREADRMIGAHDIRCAGQHQLTGTLSGGNLQKVILARELSSDPIIVLAVYPCRGLDVGSIETVRQLLSNARDKGAGVLLVSEDLDEIFALSDRVAVLCGGSMAGPIPVGEIDRVAVGLMMAGVKGRAEGADATRSA